MDALTMHLLSFAISAAITKKCLKGFVQSVGGGGGGISKGGISPSVSIPAYSPPPPPPPPPSSSSQTALVTRYAP